MNIHEKMMAEALKEAARAAQMDEVPVGAVIARDGRIIARACNLRERDKSPLAHAEIIAIAQAAMALGGWRLLGCSLYVTLEPCAMCAGAIVNARIPEVYFGAYDPKAGALGSVYDLNEGKLNHRALVQGGILEEECGGVLRAYFQNKRKRGKKDEL